MTIPNQVYRDHYQKMIFALIIIILVALFISFLVLYQLYKRPLPYFTAISQKGERMPLTPYDEPNYLPSTIIKWARKAAITAYTFDFVNYNKQLAAAKPYFTTAGWADYQRSVLPLIQSIKERQLFVNSIVVGAPVISNQGDLPGHGYTWRIQIPFLVVYQTAENTNKQNFTVLLTVVKIPTKVNPAGMGIDQFVMR